MAFLADLIPFPYVERQMARNSHLRTNMLRAFYSRELVNTYSAQFGCLLIMFIGYQLAALEIAVIGFVHMCIDSIVRARLHDLARALGNTEVETRAVKALETIFVFVGLIWALVAWPAYATSRMHGNELFLALASVAGLIIMGNTTCFAPSVFYRMILGYAFGMAIIALNTQAIPGPMLMLASIVVMITVISIAAKASREMLSMFEMQQERDVAIQEQEKTIGDLDEARHIANMLASTDSLTELPNRDAFMKHFQRQIERRTMFTLTLFDVDLFKNINDSLGHDVGDRVLRAVADTLKDTAGHHCFPARLGGDEFALVSHGAMNAAELDRQFAQITATIARRARDDIDLPVVGLTAGSATFSQDAADGAALLKAADMAQREAKRLRRGSHLHYHKELSSAFEQETTIASLLRQAIESGQVRVHFQPKINMRTGKVVGAEALTRFSMPELGNYAIDEIFAVAEHRGLGSELSDTTLAAIRIAVAELFATIAQPLQISVNLSQSSLKLPERLIQNLNAFIEAGISPALIRLEITEDAISGRGLDTVTETLDRIITLGFSLSLDDFGTGQASMNHVRSMPISEIKIDKKFVHGICTEVKDQAIVKSTLVMSDFLGLDCVAEGVESEAHAAALLTMGATIGQGRLWAGAMPLSAFATFIAHFSDQDARKIASASA